MFDLPHETLQNFVAFVDALSLHIQILQKFEGSKDLYGFFLIALIVDLSVILLLRCGVEPLLSYLLIDRHQFLQIAYLSPQVTILSGQLLTQFIQFLVLVPISYRIRPSSCFCMTAVLIFILIGFFGGLCCVSHLNVTIEI